MGPSIENCSDLQPDLPYWAKEARPAPQSWRSRWSSWSRPRIVGITWDSVHPGAQDPEAQVGPDAWTIEIRTYFKDNTILMTVHALIG
jgi:hypothetical protein